MKSKECRYESDYESDPENAGADDDRTESDFDEEMPRELSKVGGAASLLEIADKERLANCSETLGCCLIGGTEQRAHVVGTDAGRNFPLTLGLQARQQP